MKRLLIVAILLCLMGLIVLPVNAAANYLYRIAVLPLDDGSIKDRWWDSSISLGSGTTDQLITALMETKRFRIIERGEIDQVLQEQNLGQKGLLDPKTAAKIGKILGVQYLVIGRITEFNTKNDTNVLGNPNIKNPMGMVINTATARAVMDVRLVDTTTAEILTSVTGSGERKNIILGTATKHGLMVFGSNEFEKSDLGRALRKAVNSVAYQLATKAYDGNTITGVNLSGKIAYSSPDNIIINIGDRDGVQQGMVFTVNHPTDLVKDPETGEVVDEVTEPVAEIIVNTVKERTAVCSLLTRISSNYTISITDRVISKEPLKIAALPPVEPPVDPTEDKKPVNGGKLFVETGMVNECSSDGLFNNENGVISMIGGEYSFNRFKIGGERVIGCEIKTSPTRPVDISEWRIAYDLNNDGDYKMELFVGGFFMDWNRGEIKNSTYTFGADVGYNLSEKMYAEASFGYGFTPATKVNNIDDHSSSSITVVKAKVNYNLSTNTDLYLGYRSYMIDSSKNQLFSSINLGLALKF